MPVPLMGVRADMWTVSFLNMDGKRPGMVLFHISLFFQRFLGRRKIIKNSEEIVSWLFLQGMKLSYLTGIKIYKFEWNF